MAKDKITMPSGMAGIGRYYEGDSSKITFAPGHVIILAILILILITLLHTFGDALL